ncbi:MAG TPA: filamentous hemagglutinin family protein [Micropepsaceae bacterium]|jgi:filamentous hemagglutinin family protein|nr:filamentous hemagglutinin family protein [Micropepsaceae bacterium]
MALATNSAARADVVSQLSPAGLGQKASLRARSGTSAASPLDNPAVQPQVALSAANLANAAKALKDLNTSQASARAANQLTVKDPVTGHVTTLAGRLEALKQADLLKGSTWDGTALSGLKPADDSDPSLWINANPLQKNSGNSTATVQQTAPNALLTWKSFDLNNGETLVFDQQDNATWTVLNRIVAGSAADGTRLSPSYILGAIKAPGSVYVINPNGIIFGPNAQINVHSLIASTLDVGDPTMTVAERNNFFLNVGITNASNTANSHLSFSYRAADTAPEGDVVIEPGAVITANLAPRSVSPDAGGFVYLFAPNVENDGTIIAPAGEVLMVAAQAIQLTPNAYLDDGKGSFESGQLTTSPTFRAVGLNTTATALLPGGVGVPWRIDGVESAEITGPGTGPNSGGRITNNGVIQSDRGVVIVNGDVVTQAGVIQTNTSITRDGEIFLDARLKLTLASGSSTQILPDENGETAPLSAIASFTPGSIEMRGNVVDLEPGSLIEAPGASAPHGGVQVTGLRTPNLEIYPDTAAATIVAQESPTPLIYLAPGSTIDVSGLGGVILPMSDNLITFKPFGNEFADQPLQRNGALRGQSLTFDIRDGTPLADVAGMIANVQHGIDQLLTVGGTVNLTATPGAGGAIIQRQGSTINVSGGYVQYQDGVIATSNLLTADGHIVNIANASPLETYIGVAGITTLAHPHWGSNTTQTFASALLTNSQSDPGYVEGYDAGAIVLNAQSYGLDGRFVAGAIAGQRQTALGSRASGSTANTISAIATDPTTMPNAGALAINGFANVVIQNEVVPLPSDFALGTPLPRVSGNDRLNNILLSASALSDAGFRSVSVSAPGTVTVAADADLSVTPGGAINLTGGTVDIEGHLTAQSGAITATATALSIASPNIPDGTLTSTIRIGQGAILDASGLWVNDANAPPEQVLGSAYVDGGTVALKTNTASVSCGVTCFTDLTGNIVVTAGSQFDVSSGGRVGINGNLQLNAAGRRPVGKGGNITLETYVGGWHVESQATSPPTIAAPSATVVFTGSDGNASGIAAAFNSTISAYGFDQGGVLTIQVPTLQIGGAPDPASGALYLPASFFDGNAFGTYDLRSVAGGITIAQNTTVTLKQQNFLADPALLSLPSGTKLADVATLGFQLDFLRAPVNLELTATLPGVAYPFVLNGPALPPKVTLLVEQGAAIIADPGAAISLTVAGRAPSQAVNTNVGQIAAQTGVAEILGSVTAPGGSIALNGGANAEIYLGGDSVLNVQGTALVDQRQAPVRTGKVLPGGTVEVSLIDNGASAFVGLSGAQINVSGASDVFDMPLPPSITGPQFLPTPVWSDAGSIDFSAPTILYDGSFAANPGASSGAGGSLTVRLPLNKTLTVVQGGNVAPAGLRAMDVLPTSLIGHAFFQADRLAGSGIANLTLAAGPTKGEDISGGVFVPGNVVFNGNVDIAGLKSLSIDASVISLVNPGTSAAQTGCQFSINVCLSANYIALLGAGTVMPAPGKGLLEVNAKAIDIDAGNNGNQGLIALSGVAASYFVSTGDIRLSEPLANAAALNIATTLGTPIGELITAGDLTLQAAQIYPASGVDFTLKSTGANATIAFLSNGAAPDLPLSAGGQLTVSAANIVQTGTVLAPLGIIRLGAQSDIDLSPNDPTRDSFVVTQSTILGAGGVTSVSLNGRSVAIPYGETANGQDWTYNSSTGLPLSAAPTKDIAISGKAITIAGGATVDLRGGGDIQAIEFVPGTGGTTDVLSQPGVFAIIPGYDPAAVPLDFDFLFIHGDQVPVAGASVHLSAGAGLPEGDYTLLPAHYATLPGAYLVKIVPNTQDARASQNNVLPDGTLQVAGYLENQLNGTRNARTVAFDVQSGTVWRQYSEIDQTSGNSYFAAQAQASAVPPLLPIDAGHLAVDALSGLHLDGNLLLSPDVKGRGAELDIAAQDLQILSPGKTARNGYTGVDATQLTGFGAGSLLLGGVRLSDSADSTVQAISDSVEISNDANSVLQAPELILVTRTHPQNGDPNTGRGLRLDANSAIATADTMAIRNTSSLTLGDAVHNVDGSGALLALSASKPFLVKRENTQENTGLINMLAGASVQGGASLVLDTTGRIQIADTANLGATNISVASQFINFGSAPGSSGFEISNAVLGQLEQAQTLTLRSTGAIGFYADTNINLAKPGSDLILDGSALSAPNGNIVTIAVGEIDLINSGAAPAKNLAAAGGNLTLNAKTLVLGGGDKALGGFASATFDGTGQIVTRGEGSIAAGTADLTFDTPLFVVGSTSQENITTTGAVVFENTAGVQTPTATAEIGGNFSLTAGSISDSALIQAIAGGVILEATTGDIRLTADAKILAAGFVETFFDQTRFAGGGTVQLLADAGGIDVNSAARIDVSSPETALGNAGHITLATPNGVLSSNNGAAFDMAIIAGTNISDSGGSLTIDAQSIGTRALFTPSIFSDTVDVHIRQGDLTLASDLTARNVQLVADNGTLTIDRIINASGLVAGDKGGSISLYGRSVVLANGGQLNATAFDYQDPNSNLAGGSFTIGTTGTVGADGHAGLQIQSGAVINVSGGGGLGGTVRLRAPIIGGSDIYNSANSIVAIDPIAGSITGARDVTVEAYRTFTPAGTNGIFDGIIDPAGAFDANGKALPNGATNAAHTQFYQTKLVNFVQSFSLANQGNFSSISPGIVHYQPGIELDNDNFSINNGDITVASNWNLGAGKAGFLVNATDFIKKGQVIAPAGTVVTDQNGNLLPAYAAYTGALDFIAGISQITSLAYRVGGTPTGEPGTLTLRASRDININASITDGFFQTADRLNSPYLKAMNDWAGGTGFPDPTVSNVGGYVIAGANYLHSPFGPPPVAPYDAAANLISPVRSGFDPAPIAGADLFPLLAGNTPIESWSYNIAAGADLTSANPVGLRPLAIFADGNGTALAGHGNVVLNGHTDLTLANINSDLVGTHIEIPTMVRTGTGSINVAAARDLILADTIAPGVIYSAGRNSAPLADPGFKVETIPDPINPGNTIKIPVATNPDGFLAPLVLTCDPGSTYLCNPYGVLTAAAFPVDGGDLTVTVQQDILGYEHPTVASAINAGSGRVPNQQYFMPWLLVQSTPLTDTEFGAFSPLSAYVSTGGNIFTPSQTAWWINFGSFDQGLMSVGGNATIKAGRDISQLSVSLPTIGRVSGGLIGEDGTITLPVLHAQASGDLTVIAGHDLLSGAYYEGSGTGKILVGNSVKANWATSDLSGPTIGSTNDVSTVLAVDTGTIAVVARGSLNIAGVVSGTSLQNVGDTSFDPSAGVFVSSYGPSSKVTLESVSGTVVTNSLYNADALVDNIVFLENNGGVPQGYLGVSAYPANFEAIALLGDVRVADSLRLAPSDRGTLTLLAGDSVRVYAHAGGGTSFPSEAISTGPSLVEQTFDPVQPLAGFFPQGATVPDLGAILLHQDDPVPDLIYAATGDIVSGAGVAGASPIDAKAAPLAFEINTPAIMRSARDIIDVPFFGQNLAATDVTQIIAGRDLFYTGAWQKSAFAAGLYGRSGGNAGGLSLAGPGFFDIEAGRNLGPFITPAGDILDSISNNPNATGTGIITFGNNVVVGNRLMLDAQNPSLGPGSEQFARDPNDFLLPRQGADIIADFGVGNGANYQAVIDTYINPDTASSARSYLPALVDFLQTLGFPRESTTQAWATFQTLSQGIQHAFVDRVFFSELRVPGDTAGCCSAQYQIGYAVIDTLFSSTLGYTNNGANGAGPAQRVATGNLDLIHGTIKTLQSATGIIQNAEGTASEVTVGGAVSLIGPGGGIDVGTTAVEVDTKLTNSSVGILSLDNGAISAFTDGSVLVNQSRILTVQGGDVLLWSSNGDLDAGRGAKTTVDFKPLAVQFNPQDLQTINLNGLVSGAGIGTIQSTPDAPSASTFLIAPRGTVNAGDAGLRSSGDLSIAALHILNAANIAAVGTVTGVPTAAVDIAGLESTSSVGGQAAQAAADAVAAASNRNAPAAPMAAPSLITVEVLGFGNCDPEAGVRCGQ